MKSFVITLAFLLLTGSCEKKKGVLDYDVPEDIEARTYPISQVNVEKSLLYSDLYSNVDYIQLETTEQSLVGEVSKLEITDDGDLIVLDRARGSVLRFDGRGKYMCHIGRRGNGNGEYCLPMDMVYDKYHNCVIVLDVSYSRLLSYDLNGQILSSTQLGYLPLSLTVLDENHLCLYMNHFEDLSNRSVGNNFKIIDRKGRLVSEFMEYDETKGNFHPMCDNVFFSMGDNICFKQPYSSIIYSISNKNASTPTITPELYFDFGKSKIPEEWFQGDFDTFIKRLSEQSGIMYLISAYKMTNHFVLNVAKNRQVCLYIMNIKDRSLDKAGGHANNDMFGFVSSVCLSTIKDKKCYFVIDSSDFDFYKENIDKTGFEFYTVDIINKPKEYFPSRRERELLSSINEGDNPIIQVCTLKD